MNIHFLSLSSSFKLKITNLWVIDVSKWYQDLQVEQSKSVLPFEGSTTDKCGGSDKFCHFCLRSQVPRTALLSRNIKLCIFHLGNHNRRTWYTYRTTSLNVEFSAVFEISWLSFPVRRQLSSFFRIVIEAAEMASRLRESETLFEEVCSVDFLKFSFGGRGYQDQLYDSIAKTDALAGVKVECLSFPSSSIAGSVNKVVWVTHNFGFLGGSLGCAEGEKITRAFEYGLQHKVYTNLEVVRIDFVMCGGWEHLTCTCWWITMPLQALWIQKGSIAVFLCW